MNIQLVTPAPLRVNNGNRITALRWAQILRALGHRVRIEQQYGGGPCDVLIALHARRSFASIERFRNEHPERPLIVVLTGTDLYRDIHRDRRAQRSLELATNLVGLQRMAFEELPEQFHAKTRIIYQSAPQTSGPPAPGNNIFSVAVVGHLRKEKDPLRAALAARSLPASSRIQIVHIGRALDDSFETRAMREMRRNPRYRWLGELPHGKTRRMLAQSRLLVISSRVEGSANVLSEALASFVPVVASRISGLIGTLGKDYPGYFSVGSTQELKRLLMKAEGDSRFYAALKRRCAELRKLVEPRRELQAWESLLRELPET